MSSVSSTAGSIAVPMRKVWTLRAPGARGLPAAAITPAPAREPGVGLVERVLAARGLTDPAVAHEFLNPALRQLHDPSLIPDLDKAATRILGAIRAGEPVAIYGDYDVDGVTATAILYHTLRALAPLSPPDLVRTYVPHRLEEGYGLNAAAITQLAQDGARVIVSVDCGITAVEPARAARAAGVDLIITDHHNPPETLDALPPAFAVVHPRRPDSSYPFGDLSGAGVAYKLAWRLATLACGATKVTAELRALLIELLAFAALGAVADVMPLEDENRVIARFGLGRVKHSAFEGLRALVEASHLAGEDIDSEHAGFALAPRLNACGRLGHARDAVELFTTATGARAAEIARELSRKNDERRRLEKKIADHAIELAEAAGMTRPEARAIVLAHEDWHPGVLGIVCSRLVERYHRPTILMKRQDGSCHGSGRSIPGYSLHAGLAACAAHLGQFGGHDMAAGLKLPALGLEAFVEAFSSHAEAHLTPDLLMPTLRYDTDATLGELTTGAIESLGRLAPFGIANPKPRLLLRGIRVVGGPTPFGSDGKHAGILVSETGSRATPMRLVAWKWADRAVELRPGMEIEALVSPKLNRWNGRVSVEPELDDLRVVR